MTGKFKKYLAIVLIAFLMVYNTGFARIAFADDLTPTPTFEEPQNNIDNTSATQNETNANSNTGDNAINPTPTDSPTPTDEVTPTPSGEVVQNDVTPTPSENLNITETPTPSPDGTNIDNSSDVTNTIGSEGNTGNNQIATPSAEQQDNACTVPGSSDAIDTGDALSSTDIINSINSTDINSEVIFQTINIFVDANGNLDLSDPYTIASQVIPEHEHDSVINLSVTNVNNYAYLSNDVISYANSGNNSINGLGGGLDAIINTGNAYSLVSLLNKVNFTVINSKIHIVSINVFGNLNGNIILPDLNTSTSCATCGVSTNLGNTANVVNNVDSHAVSGENTVTGYSGSIQTGDAESIVNNINLINSNFIGTFVQGLFINLLGNWTGDFLGWGGIEGFFAAGNLGIYNTGPLGDGTSDCAGCTGDLNATNTATVINNVSSFANTGGNSIFAKNGSINTGNAYSSVSLINFINSNFINSVGFFGFINIFGNWTGDIGGKSYFTETEEPQVAAVATTSDEQRQSGGVLSVTNTNNVGAFVYSGDTVTIFAKVKNTGTGKVYGAKLGLFLIQNDENLGWRSFDLGDIEPGKSVKVTTGMVLSQGLESGQYIIRAVALGETGPDNEEVNSEADSSFIVHGHSFAAASSGSGDDNQPSVLGTQYPAMNNKAAATTDRALYALLAILMSYILIRGIRQRENIKEIFLKNISLKEKVVALRMFLM